MRKISWICLVFASIGFFSFWLSAAEEATAPEVRVKKFLLNAGSANEPILENAYVVYLPSTGDAVLVDPGAADPKIEAFVFAEKLKIGRILNTHGHSDHSSANRYYADLFNVKIQAHKDDLFLYAGGNAANRPDEFLIEKEAVAAGELHLEVLHTPGHTPGSVCFHAGGKVLTGDTLFAGGIGKYFGQGETEQKTWKKKEIDSICKKLLKLSDYTLVFPGHGLSTSIGDERAANPFLQL